MANCYNRQYFRQSKNCKPGSTNFNPPTNMFEVFVDLTNFNSVNCGDLIFSGHMFETTTFIIVAFYYRKTILGWNKVFERVVLSILVLTGFCEILTILSERDHYTVDVVVALYVAPLLWTTVNVYWKEIRPVNKKEGNMDSRLENRGSENNEDLENAINLDKFEQEGGPAVLEPVVEA